MDKHNRDLSNSTTQDVFVQEQNEANIHSKQETNIFLHEFSKMKSVAYFAKISMLSAIGVLLLMIEFPLFPAVPHLKMNFSDMPALIASFMFGPISGTIVNAVKVGIALLIRGTTTAFVGDLSNLVSGTIYAVIAGSIYYFKKSKKGAVVSLGISSILFCASMWVCNQFFLLPMFKITQSDVIMTMLLWTLLFNVVKVVATSVLTFVLYKGTHKLFDRF